MPVLVLLPPSQGKASPDHGRRSGSYAAAWRPRRATHLVVRAFTEAPDGTRTVISHMAKQVRGEVAAGPRPRAQARLSACAWTASMVRMIEIDSSRLSSGLSGSPAANRRATSSA